MRRSTLCLATLSMLLPLAPTPAAAQWRSEADLPSAGVPVLPAQGAQAYAPAPGAATREMGEGARTALAPVVLATLPRQGGEAQRGPGRALVGSILGGAAGIAVGAVAGASLFGECTDPGNPDSCISQLEYGVIGAYWGNTLGAPIGAHLANGRRGSLGRSLAVSTGLAVAGAVALRAAGYRANDSDSRVTPRIVLPLVLFGVPITQVVTSTAIESGTARQ